MPARLVAEPFHARQIMEWFYQDVAGIGGDPAGPGFKKIIIRPQPVGDLTWARAGYDRFAEKSPATGSAPAANSP